jgi:hypothetical protein
MLQNRVLTKIFINSYNDKNVTLYGRRWNPDGSSSQKTSREENRRKETRREKSGQQKEMMWLSPLTFFFILKIFCSVEIPPKKRVLLTTERSKVHCLLTLMCRQIARRQQRNQQAGISGLSRPPFQS